MAIPLASAYQLRPASETVIHKRNALKMLAGRRIRQAMPKPKDLIAFHIPEEDTGDYRVREAGWYAVDDGGKVVLGPFVSLAECERAIRDRLNPPA
jgi:hypothetical protein